MSHHYENGPDIAASNKRIQEIEAEKKRLEREKKNIIEKEETRNKEAIELSKQLQKLKEVKHKTELAIVETQKKLYKLCTHDPDQIEKKKRYIEGGYLNQGEDITEYWCKLCGIKVDEEVRFTGFS